MAKIHIVTDSGVRFSNPRLARHFPLTILPNTLEIAGTRYREGVDISAEEAFQLMTRMSAPPRVLPPSEQDYADLFARLSRVVDAVISIHPSRELSSSWQNGRNAAQRANAKCEIAVVDSRSLCAGQGMLIRVAARVAKECLPIEEAINAVRQAVERIFSAYCVEDLRFLSAKGYIKPSHAILCTHLGLKPFVSVENGEIIIIEKMREHNEVIERLVEYLVEFNELDDAIVLQHDARISDATRHMHDLLAEEFPGQHFPFTMYSATMASYLGTKAWGVAVLEKEEDLFDDAF